MSTTLDFNLKKSFRTHYPDYASRLDKAKTYEEFDRVHQEIIAEVKANLRSALEKANLSVSEEDYGATASFALMPEMYHDLISADGSEIKRLLQTLMDGLERLEKLGPDADAKYFTAQMLAGTLTAVTVFGISGFAAQMMLEAAVVAEAALVGVFAATPLVIVEVIALVIVSVLIPIIYFMMKPANCVILLVNELDESITFESQFNVHGKPSIITSPILQRTVLAPDAYVNAGFIATEKRAAALYGTQYGVTYKTASGVQFAFGTECPLSSMYTDNNCFCAFNTTAKDAAYTTEDKNKQEWSCYDEGSKLQLSIKCHSGAGSVAYYVARIYKKA